MHAASRDFSSQLTDLVSPDLVSRVFPRWNHRQVRFQGQFGHNSAMIRIIRERKETLRRSHRDDRDDRDDRDVSTMTRWHWHCAVIVSDTIRGRNHDTNRSVRPSRAPLTGLRRMRITADQVRFLSGINTNRSPTERPGESRAAFLRDEIASEEMLQRYFSKPAPFTDHTLAIMSNALWPDNARLIARYP
jgi:hypothetical protein